MNRNELKEVLLLAARPSANVNFSDAQEAAKNALNAYLEANDFSVRDFRPGTTVFRIVDEVIDEVVPLAVQDRTQAFAEIKNFGREDQIKFDVPTSRASRRRMYKALKKGARGGIYRAYRLDGYSLSMNTVVYTVGYQLTLEEILLGYRTVNEMINIIADAWTEEIFVEVWDALTTAAAAAPTPNIYSGAFSEADVDGVIKVINGYGSAIILGFKSDLGKISNPAGDAFAQADWEDIRTQGYVGVYKGTPLVELPNYLINHTASAAEFLFTEGNMYVMPADFKPVKVAFQGTGYTSEFTQPHGGVEWQNHRMMGVAVLFNKAIGTLDLT